MLRRPTPHGPTEADLEGSDLEGTTTVVGDYDFDTPRVEDVLQAETGFPDRPIPVRLVNPVKVNQLPTRLGTLKSVPLAASPAGAIKILNEDPRRAAVTIPSSNVELAIGRSQVEADDANAFRLFASNGPYRFHFTEELWARSVAGATRISVAVEQWAR